MWLVETGALWCDPAMSARRQGGKLGPRRNSPDVHRAVCVCHVDAPSGALRCVCRIDTHTHTHTYIVYTAIIYNYISIHYSSI